MEKKVFIVDDDPALLDILKELLNDEGYCVKATDGTGDLMMMIRDFNPDIVILDFLLHGINGGEICHLVKQNSQTSHLPVIILSAYPRVIRSLGLYGCDEFIPKPFDLCTLIERINYFTMDQLAHEL